MKQLIIEIPDDLHKELKLSSLELDISMKEYVNEILFLSLVNNLKNFPSKVRAECNVTDSDLKDRLSKVRKSRINS